MGTHFIEPGFTGYSQKLDIWWCETKLSASFISNYIPLNWKALQQMSKWNIH